MPQSILIVDDDRLFREMTTEMLVRRGHRVVAVANGHQALEAFAQHRYDLVLTDLVMPGVDGLALIARLRERDPDQEVILVSGRSDPNVSLIAMRAGAADYLVKPVEENDFQLSVQRCLERVALRRERSRLQDENREHARFEALNRHCLEFLSDADLESLQERVLSDLSAVCDAQSGVLWLSTERSELRLRAYRGLVDRQRVSERLDPSGPLGNRLRAGAPWLAGQGLASTLNVPLVAQGELLGLAQLSDPLSGEFKDGLLKSAGILGDFAAVAVRNARKFASLQRQSLRDRDTAAYNLSYFTDYASKEIYKARRYGRTFSLLTFSLDQVTQLRVQVGVEEVRRATRGVIRAFSRIIRDADVIAKATEQEFYLLLPETDFFGALMFMRRALAAAREDPDVRAVEAKSPLGLVGGAATYPKDGEDFDELVHRCRKRMDERRVSLQRKLQLGPLPFWDEVDLLLGSPQSPKLPGGDALEPSRRGKVADVLFDEIQAEVGRELLRDPGARGLLYVGAPQVHSSLPIAVSLEAVPPDFAPHVYLLGRRADVETSATFTPVFLDGDERIGRYEFLLWLSENSAYALLQRRGRGATWGFHSSDTAVVEELIGKLQSEYDLQPY